MGVLEVVEGLANFAGNFEVLAGRPVEVLESLIKSKTRGRVGFGETPPTLVGIKMVDFICNIV